MNAAGQVAPPHPADVEVFVSNQVVLPDELESGLVVEIESLPCDRPVQLGDLLNGLPAPVAALVSLAADCPLRGPERRCPLPLDWAWGFQEARRQIFLRQDMYCPSDRLELTAACTHPDPALLDARQLGMLAYLYELVGHGRAWDNAAD
ncbi:hypothetical protein ASF71_19320 [Deinococcus sp. Leaf326]|nr:hypothetical protein ASF71_19320 [Deinococcus sp. Leaf326]